MVKQNMNETEARKMRFDVILAMLNDDALLTKQLKVYLV